ncbi:MAG: hypothetical protein KFF73_17725, partial [Cyclobacteriaceae bacterium]|nr:hypothetical protein [Cyclobacteriaceae bacterium]
DNIFMWHNNNPVLRAFEFNRENIKKMNVDTGIRGIAMQGGREEKVGFKDYEVLADILDALESE